MDKNITDKNKKDNISVPGFVDRQSSKSHQKKVHKTDFVLPLAVPEPVLNETPKKSRKDYYNDNRGGQSSNKGSRDKRSRIKLNRYMLAALVMIPIAIIFVSVISAAIKPSGSDGRAANVSAGLPENGGNSHVSVKNVETTSAAGDYKTWSYERNNNVICIDAGHGGHDPGAERNKVYEKDQVLSVTLLVKEYLEAEGYEVVLTRDTDMAVSLDDRVKIAEAANAGVLVSIHRNYYQPGALASGVECWIHNSAPSDALGLAKMIMEELDKLGLSNNRGIKTGTIENSNENYKINKSMCTSLILELGFITNSKDDALVISNRSECAKAIADGISRYIKSVEVTTLDF